MRKLRPLQRPRRQGPDKLRAQRKSFLVAVCTADRMERADRSNGNAEPGNTVINPKARH